MEERKVMENNEFESMLQEALKIPREGEIVKGVVVKVTPQEVYIDIVLCI